MEDLRKTRLRKNFRNYIYKKDMFDIKKEDIDKFITKYMKSTNRCAFYSNISYLNDILNEYGYNISIDSREYVDKCIVSTNKIVSKEEVLSICNGLVNFTDKFIVYALFNEIMGKGYSELRNLTISDISKDFNYIKTSEKLVKCDEYMKAILIGLVIEDTYILHGKRTITGAIDFPFNMNSKYLIKVKPTTENMNGLMPISVIGIQTKLKVITKELQNEGWDIVINGNGLLKSGRLHKMHEYALKNNLKMSVREMSDYMKENKVPGDLSEIYRFYHDKYSK